MTIETNVTKIIDKHLYPAKPKKRGRPTNAHKAFMAEVRSHYFKPTGDVKMTTTTEQQIAELKQSLAMAKQKKSLRDEFAMAALTGLLSDPQNCGTHKSICSDAYDYAEAMMKERRK